MHLIRLYLLITVTPDYKKKKIAICRHSNDTPGTCYPQTEWTFGNKYIWDLAACAQIPSFWGTLAPWVATFVKYSLYSICLGALPPSGSLISAWQNTQLGSSILEYFFCQETTRWISVLTWTGDKGGQIPNHSCQYQRVTWNTET